jgi:hypothetical protein
MVKIQEPDGQTEPDFLSLPGGKSNACMAKDDNTDTWVELRNKIYDFTFDDGKCANLQFLQTCRQVWHEASTTAFSTIALNMDHQQPPTRALKKLPEALRNAIQVVHYGRNAYGHSQTPILAHRASVFPVHAVERLYPPEGHDYRFTVMLGRIFDQGWANGKTRSQIEPYHFAIFGQFLDNPRLRTWRYELAQTTWIAYSALVTVREDNDGNPMKAEPKSCVPYQFSKRLRDNAWLKGLTVNAVAEDFSLKDENVVFVIRHKDMPGQSVRVRFRRDRTDDVDSTDEDNAISDDESASDSDSSSADSTADDDETSSTDSSMSEE